MKKDFIFNCIFAQYYVHTQPIAFFNFNNKPQAFLQPCTSKTSNVF